MQEAKGTLEDPKLFPKPQIQELYVCLAKAKGRGDQVIQGTIGVTLHQAQYQLPPASSKGDAFPPAQPLGQVCGHHPSWAHGAREGKHPARK